MKLCIALDNESLQENLCLLNLYTPFCHLKSKIFGSKLG